MTKQDIADKIATQVRSLSVDGKVMGTDVSLINNLAASLFARYPVPTVATPDGLTVRGAVELVEHESIVLEWYLDNAKPPVGTWGIGVTAASGHNVSQYKDKPSTIEHVLDVYVDLLRKTYIPAVLRAFKGTPLTEAQLAAALSFHYNTGAIEHTDWVGMWLGGSKISARQFWESHYLNGGALTARRKAEAALFFDGKWTSDGKVTVYPVNKPSYTPAFGKGYLVDIRADMALALA
jgi:lysozyme